MDKLLDLYTDYLLSSFGQTSATGLSNLLDNAVKHDHFTRLLKESEFDSKYLWLSVKSLVREHQTDEACLIFDDSIVEKPYTDENDMVCWHWDHSKSRNVKGINILTAFYHTHKSGQTHALRVPVAVECIKKTIRFCDLKTKKEKRASPITKNELMRNMITQSITNGLIFRYVLGGSWFASSENMRFIASKNKFFIFDLQSNRLGCLSEENRNQGSWTNIDQLEMLNNTPIKVWIKDLEFPILITKQVFINKDYSTGVRYLASNDFTLSDEQFTTVYKKRWSVEEYHKSIKQNASIAKSPTRTVQTQTNHLFASVLAYIKLERLKFANKMSHFTLKAKIYQCAIKAAFNQLIILKQTAHA